VTGERWAGAAEQGQEMNEISQIDSASTTHKSPCAQKMFGVYIYAITFFGEAPRSAYGCRCEGAARLARLRLDLQAATAV
jgi:hypothetical protein